MSRGLFGGGSAGGSVPPPLLERSQPCAPFPLLHLPRLLAFVTRHPQPNSPPPALAPRPQHKQQLFVETGGSGAAGGGGSGAGGGGQGAPQLAVAGGEEDEAASLASAAPRQEVMVRTDMAYLLDALLV